MPTDKVGSGMADMPSDVGMLEVVKLSDKVATGTADMLSDDGMADLPSNKVLRFSLAFLFYQSFWKQVVWKSPKAT